MASSLYVPISCERLRALVVIIHRKSAIRQIMIVFFLIYMTVYLKSIDHYF